MNLKIGLLIMTFITRAWSDTHHCVVTRFMEYYYWHAKGEPEDEYFDDLEAVHIIPSAYESWRADAMVGT